MKSKYKLFYFLFMFTSFSSFASQQGSFIAKNDGHRSFYVTESQYEIANNPATLTNITNNQKIPDASPHQILMTENEELIAKNDDIPSLTSSIFKKNRFSKMGNSSNSIMATMIGINLCNREKMLKDWKTPMTTQKDMQDLKTVNGFTTYLASQNNTSKNNRQFILHINNICKKYISSITSFKELISSVQQIGKIIGVSNTNDFSNKDEQGRLKILESKLESALLNKGTMNKQVMDFLLHLCYNRTMCEKKWFWSGSRFSDNLNVLTKGYLTNLNTPPEILFPLITDDGTFHFYNLAEMSKPNDLKSVSLFQVVMSEFLFNAAAKAYKNIEDDGLVAFFAHKTNIGLVIPDNEKEPNNIIIQPMCYQGQEINKTLCDGLECDKKTAKNKDNQTDNRSDEQTFHGLNICASKRGVSKWLYTNKNFPDFTDGRTRYMIENTNCDKGTKINEALISTNTFDYKLER